VRNKGQVTLRQYWRGLIDDTQLSLKDKHPEAGRLRSHLFFGHHKCLERLGTVAEKKWH
jgi:hypothetical protein